MNWLSISFVIVIHMNSWSFELDHFNNYSFIKYLSIQHTLAALHLLFFCATIPSTLPWTKEQELPGFFGSIVFSGLKDTGIASCIIWQGYSQKGPVADITWRIRFNRRLAGVRNTQEIFYPLIPLDVLVEKRDTTLPPATATAWKQQLPSDFMASRELHSLKLAVRTWKWMVGILVSLWEGLFLGALLVLGRVPFR